MNPNTSTSADAQSVDQLLSQAAALEHSPLKTSLIEEAVRLADCTNDEDLAYSTRMELVTAAIFGGQPDKAIVAYAWCLAVADRRPEDFPWHDLLWKYKWIVDNARDYPSLPRARIEEMLEDMRRRFHGYGDNDHAYLQIRTKVFRGFGELDEARDAVTKAKKLSRDFLSDCEACWVHSQVKLHGAAGRYGMALKLAKPILAGRLSCSTVPFTTHAALLVPLLFLGQPEEAERLHRLNYPKVRRKLQFLLSVAEHLEYLAITGKTQAATRLLEAELGQALELGNPQGRFHFLTAACFFLERRERAGKEKIRLRLQRNFPLFQAEGYYDVKALAGWFRREATTLAEAFDQRNGNAYFAGQIQGLARLHRHADRLAAQTGRT